MKILALLIFVCLQTSLPLAQGQSIRDVIDEFIQRLKNLIPEPVELPDVGVVLPENDYVSANANVTNGTLSGLRDFNVEVYYRGIIIPIPTGFTITLHNQSLYEDFFNGLQIYNSSVLVYANEGNFRTVTSDLVIKGDLDFTIIPLNFTVTSLWFNVGDIQFEVEGVVSDRFSELLSKILSNTVANALNRYQEPISAVLVNIVNEIIGNIFGEMYAHDPENLPLEASEESSVEELRRFFEALETFLGFNNS